MKEISGKVFSIATENIPIRGCTISKAVSSKNGFSVSHFSLSENTDISAESYSYPKLWIMAGGKVVAFDGSGKEHVIEKGRIFITPTEELIGVRAEKDSIYTEIALKENTEMNDILKAGEVLILKELIPYQEDRIVNMDLVNEPHLKFVLMSFDEGTGLAEHAAPGDALVFALDGEAVIGYEGKDYTIKEGENFKFDKFGKHSVTAKGRFKMALLLMLE